MSELEQPLTDEDGPVLGEPDFIVDEATDEVLKLHLDQFQGPLEVLLYLIKSQEIDIFDIPIVKITEQYLRFLDLMEEENLDVTGEFLVIAATLIQIKSKMLLPAETDEEEEDIEEEDPRLELVTKLLEYRRFKEVTELLANLEAEREAWYSRNVKPRIEADPDEEDYLEVSLYDLLQAFKGVLRFMREDLVQTVHGEEASVDDKIQHITDLMETSGSVAWSQLFVECRSRVEIVCCFLAILELCRMGRVRANQHKAHDEIRLFPIPHEAAESVAG